MGIYNCKKERVKDKAGKSGIKSNVYQQSFNCGSGLCES